MRTVRNIVNTGRTIVCTIHQPSIDIFESFDELLLLKRGGETIFAGQLGHLSTHLINYFQVVVTVAACHSCTVILLSVAVSSYIDMHICYPIYIYAHYHAKSDMCLAAGTQSGAGKRVLLPLQRVTVRQLLLQPHKDGHHLLLYADDNASAHEPCAGCTAL